jgi:hypothetical protein
VNVNIGALVWRSTTDSGGGWATMTDAVGMGGGEGGDGGMGSERGRAVTVDGSGRCISILVALGQDEM